MCVGVGFRVRDFGADLGLVVSVECTLIIEYLLMVVIFESGHF